MVVFQAQSLNSYMLLSSQIGRYHKKLLLNGKNLDRVHLE